MLFKVDWFRYKASDFKTNTFSGSSLAGTITHITNAFFLARKEIEKVLPMHS